MMWIWSLVLTIICALGIIMVPEFTFIWAFGVGFFTVMTVLLYTQER